jgi:hypothetical protein
VEGKWGREARQGERERERERGEVRRGKGDAEGEGEGEEQRHYRDPGKVPETKVSRNRVDEMSITVGCGHCHL